MAEAHKPKADRTGYLFNSSSSALGVLEVGGVEALSELLLNVGEHRALSRGQVPDSPPFIM